MSTFGWSSAQAYAHEGFSGMNGRSDTGEIFTQNDFQTVLNYAQGNGMSRFTFWSVNRDRQCTPVDNNGNTSSECSSVAQNSWDFTRYSVAFANSTSPSPGPTPTPTPTPTRSPTPSPSPTPTGGGCTAPAWVNNVAYVSGNVVSYGGHKWTANQWNYNEVPGGPAGAWNDNGAC
jgi:chitinase